MKIVIDIPEAMYRHYKKVWHKRRGSVPESYIAFGTPLPKEKWIPVSDPLNELPKDKHLLVTAEADVWHGEKSRYVTELYYDMTEWSDINDAENAIAYMPYPKSYAESEDRNANSN